jgi:hypothetical protein
MSLDDADLLSLEDSEIINSLYQLATLLTLMSGKKINFQNVFILVLTDKRFNYIAKEITGLDSDIEICKYLLEIDPSLVKSKLILQYLNGRIN